MPTVVIAVLAIACACMGGVFFAFSTFVMRALGALPAAAGIRAMQSINVLAVTPVFMTALFGTAVACVSATGGTGRRGTTSGPCRASWPPARSSMR